MLSPLQMEALNDTNVVYEIASSASSNVTFINAVDVERKQEVTWFINLLIPPILITIGVTCNSMTVLTMRTKFFRKVSTSVYFKVGAINDILALLISLSAHWLYVNMPDVYIRTDSSHFMCKFFNFYGSGNNDLGILLTASMTTERALAIASPFGAARFNCVKRAWKIVSGIITFVVIKNMHYLLSSDIVPAGRTDRLCDVFPERLGPAYETFYYDLYPWIHLAYVLLCGIAIVVNNSIILYNVHKSHADRTRKSGSAWRHLVPMLIGESVLLIVLTFPFSMHLALLAIRLKYDETIYTDPTKAATESLVFSVTFYMLYSNKVANFFMYCITGSRFREGLSSALLDLFKLKRMSKAMTSSVFVSVITERVKNTEIPRCHGDCKPMSCAMNSDVASVNDVMDYYSYMSSSSERTQKSTSIYV